MKHLFLAIFLSFVGLTPLSAQNAPTSPNNLVSPDTNIDYTPLQRLLANEQWREANEETNELILEAANRERQGWLSTDDILNLSCWDLKTIDELWTKYSQGRFGFSAQFPIFMRTGNRPGRLMAIDAYEQFGDKVGWRSPQGSAADAQQQWIIFKENINYSLDAPVGHLPQVRQQYNLTGNRLQYTTLTQRLVDCKIVDVPAP